MFGFSKSPPTATSVSVLRTASEKIPPASLRTTGVSVTDQVFPRSTEWNTRAAAPPPAIQASSLPAVTRQVPLAAKPNSPSSAGGMPAPGRFAHDRPPSLVTRIRNFPFTGSLIASPCRRSQKLRQS